MIKKIAFKIVYKELLKHGMIRGNYSGSKNAEHFMYGIATVMEMITYFAGGDELADEYSKMFLDNMTKSEQNLEERNGKQGEVSEDLS